MAQGNEKKNMEKQLRQYAAACTKISAEMDTSGKREKCIKELLQRVPSPRTRGSRWDFVLEQVGYLGRYCLIWQILWAALFGYLVQNGIPYAGVLVLLSILPPLLVLLTVGEVTKIYQRSMLEIECATKYSLQNVVIVRMLVLSVMHSLILAVAIVVFHAGLDTGIGKLFVYGFTPMVIVTGILIWLMQHCHGERLRSAYFGVYGLTVALAIMGNTGHFGWYQPGYFHLWCMALAVGFLFGVWQFTCLRKSLVSFEQLLDMQ